MKSKPIIGIRLYKGNDTLKAYADVTFRVKFGEVTIKRFKVLLDEKGKPWVAPPQIQYIKYLMPKYINLLHMNKRVETYLTNQILKAYRNAVRKSSKKQAFSA